MKNKFTEIILMLFVFTLFAAQSRAQQEFEKYAGTYVTGHSFGFGSIELTADGIFSDGGGRDDGTTGSSSGSYTFSNGFLHFKVEKKTLKRREDEEVDLLDSKNDSKVERDFKVFPVEWSGRIYLIYERDLKAFANAVNLGVEPRPALFSRDDTSPWIGSFFLRDGDERKRVTGNPKLPEEWLSFLLSKPVTATVTDIQEIEKRPFSTITVITINKGSNAGLKAGMKLLAKDEAPSLSGQEIISVERNTAKIKIWLSERDKLKIGD